MFWGFEVSLAGKEKATTGGRTRTGEPSKV